MNGGRQNVRWRLSGQLNNQLREIGLHRLDAALQQRVVQTYLLGHHRLDLYDFSRALCLYQFGNDAICFPRVPRPMHLPTCCLYHPLELDEIHVEGPKRLLLDGRRRVAEIRPVGQVFNHARSVGSHRAGGPGEISS